MIGAFEKPGEVMDKTTAKENVLQASKLLVHRGLVARTWGNISCRIDEKTFAITPSGIGYERLNKDNIVVVHMESLKHEGQINPSSEKGFHASCYMQNPHTNFVIHTHQTYASCISVSGSNSLKLTDEEKSILGGPVIKADYGFSGTKKLRRQVEKALSKGSSAILLEKHGAVLTGENPEMTFKRAEVLEDVCKRVTQAPDFSDKPIIKSRRSDNRNAIIEEADSPELNDHDADIVARLHTQIFQRYPQFNNIMHLNSEAVIKVMKKTKKLEPYLDDFAQMVGNDAKVCPSFLTSPERESAQIINDINNRNCVLVKDLGAVCCAESEGDCRALLTLVEKNCIAYLNAESNGEARPLSLFDRKLMRYIYTKKYSKKK